MSYQEKARVIGAAFSAVQPGWALEEGQVHHDVREPVMPKAIFGWWLVSFIR